MNSRRFVTFAASAVAAFGSAAFAAEQNGAPLNLDSGGGANCTATQCMMSRITATGQPKADVGVTLVFDRTRMQPRVMVIQVPANADQKAGVKFGFADVGSTEKIVSRPWRAEFSAPITSCEKDACAARIEDDITVEGHNLQKDVVENILKYGAMTFSFQAGGKDVAAAVTTAALKGDQTLMLTESKRTDQNQGAGARQQAGWDIQCRDKICTMTHSMSAEHKGKAMPVGAALQFDRAGGKPNFLIIQVPPDADRDAGAEIAFFDSPNTPNRRETAVSTLPFAQCDSTSCIARVASDSSQADRDLQLKIVNKALEYPFMAVGYHTSGERVAAIEPTDHFKQDYQTLLADLKKPQ